MKRQYSGIVMLALVAGCVRYAPAPVSPSQLATQRGEARIDPALVAVRLAALGSIGDFDLLHWNRLALFAAMLDGNADIAAARTAIDTAKAARRAAGARPGPTLTLASEYTRKAPESSPWLFGGVIDIPIDAGGRRASRLALADLGVIAARYDFIETVWMVRMVLRRGLADHLLAQQRLLVTAEISALRQRQFNAMARRVNAGAASRADLERVRADTADAVRRESDARTQLIAGNAAIAAALGVPAAAITGMAFVWPGFSLPAAQPLVDAATRAAAIAARADILKSAIQYDQAEADLRSEIARQYPAISIGPGYTWERGLVKLPINLALILPPLDGNRGAIAAAEARRTEAGKRLEALVAAAQNSIDSALADTQQTRRALEKIRRGELPAATRLALQADRELAAGSIDRTEWAAAKAGARLASLSELDAIGAVLAADARLEEALRRPIEGPELAIKRGLEGL